MHPRTTGKIVVGVDGAPAPEVPGASFDSGPGSTTLSRLRQARCPVVVLPTVGDQVCTAVSDDRPPTLV